MKSIKSFNGTFQNRVWQWIVKCFGRETASDCIERNHRFLEEALELVQSCGCTRREASQLVEYVFNRPAGEVDQEVGGVLVTLAALCQAKKTSMSNCGEVELQRIWGKMDQIRAKQSMKPRYSPLPE